MAQKRYDNKRRVLKDGEYQKKSGVYEYRYIGIDGKKHSIYSWKLVESDKTPKGKRDTSCLRSLERGIARDLEDGINSQAAKVVSFDAYFMEFMEHKAVKESTRYTQTYFYTHFARKAIGKKGIADIKFSDIVSLYTHLIRDEGIKPSTVKTLQQTLHPVFETAVRDDYIRKNPTDGALSQIKRAGERNVPSRKALTEEQQAAFINYVRTSPKYCWWTALFVFLLGTGCRIGEATGLRWDDCDFENNTISINHSLAYTRYEDDIEYRFHVSTPKTEAGVREIPMLPEVKAVLLDERHNQELFPFDDIEVDGYSGFVFRHFHTGNLISMHGANYAIKAICAKYNAEEKERAKAEDREPILLPYFSAHIFRHTFCTRLCENQSDKVTLKHVQYIMGHADIGTTLDIYTDLTGKQIRGAMEAMEGRIYLG